MEDKEHLHHRFIFGVFDKDKDGFVNIEELSGLIRYLRKNIDESVLGKVAREVKNSGGKVDFEGFVLLIQSLSMDNANVKKLKKGKKSKKQETGQPNEIKEKMSKTERHDVKKTKKQKISRRKLLRLCEKYKRDLGFAKKTILMLERERLETNRRINEEIRLTENYRKLLIEKQHKIEELMHMKDPVFPKRDERSSILEYEVHSVTYSYGCSIKETPNVIYCPTGSKEWVRFKLVPINAPISDEKEATSIKINGISYTNELTTLDARPVVLTVNLFFDEDGVYELKANVRNYDLDYKINVYTNHISEKYSRVEVFEKRISKTYTDPWMRKHRIEDCVCPGIFQVFLVLIDRRGKRMLFNQILMEKFSLFMKCGDQGWRRLPILRNKLDPNQFLRSGGMRLLVGELALSMGTRYYFTVRCGEMDEKDFQTLGLGVKELGNVNIVEFVE